MGVGDVHGRRDPLGDSPVPDPPGHADHREGSPSAHLQGPSHRVLGAEEITGRGFIDDGDEAVPGLVGSIELTAVGDLADDGAGSTRG